MEEDAARERERQASPRWNADIPVRGHHKSMEESGTRTPSSGLHAETPNTSSADHRAEAHNKIIESIEKRGEELLEKFRECARSIPSDTAWQVARDRELIERAIREEELESENAELKRRIAELELENAALRAKVDRQQRRP